MTSKEWVLFILFNIVINIIFQVLAWKIAHRLAQTKRRSRK